MAFIRVEPHAVGYAKTEMSWCVFRVLSNELFKGGDFFGEEFDGLCFCLVLIVGGKELLEIFWFGVAVADDSILVDEEGNGYSGDAEVIEGVC